MSQTTHLSTTITYNALSQVKTTEDPAGNVFTNLYDKVGRVYERQVNTSGSTGFDTTVTSIQYSYTDRGQLEQVEQTGFANKTSFSYDDWGHPSLFEENFAGNRDSAITSFAYTDISSNGGARRVVLDSWSQPDGGQGLTDYHMIYTPDTIDGFLGRPSWIEDHYSTPMAFYGYLGACKVINTGYPEPIVETNLCGGGLLEGGDSGYGCLLDTFNRPILNQWLKNLGGSPLNPTFVDYAMAWDERSQLISVKDEVLRGDSVPGVRTYDQLNQYDGLGRLTVRDEGELDSPPSSIATLSRTEGFGRNLAGRITQDSLDLNANTDYTDGPPDATGAGEMDDDRSQSDSYNQRNELRNRYVIDYTDPSTPRQVTLTYDYNGNLTDDGEKFTYKYDAWGRLTEVHDRTTTDPLAKYTYNGIGHRVAEQLDADGNGDCTNDPLFYIATDLSGRRIATFREQDTYPKETFLWHPAGMNGPAFKGGLIARDRNSGLADDPGEWASEAGDASRPERVYACSDFRGNVVALLAIDYSEAGYQVQERYAYSATGVPTGIPSGDVNADGKVDCGGFGYDFDQVVIDDISSGTYEVRGDINLDGVVDGEDYFRASMQDGVQVGRGGFSMPNTMSRAGLSNREFSFATTELATLSSVQMWTPAPNRSGCSIASGSMMGCDSFGCGGIAPLLAQPGVPSVPHPCGSCGGTITDVQVRNYEKCGPWGPDGPAQGSFVSIGNSTVFLLTATAIDFGIIGRTVDGECDESEIGRVVLPPRWRPLPGPGAPPDPNLQANPDQTLFGVTCMMVLKVVQPCMRTCGIYQDISIVGDCAECPDNCGCASYSLSETKLLSEYVMRRSATRVYPLFGTIVRTAPALGGYECSAKYQKDAILAGAGALCSSPACGTAR